MTTTTAAPTRFVAITADTGLTNHSETRRDTPVRRLRADWSERLGAKLVAARAEAKYDRLIYLGGCRVSHCA